MRAQRLVSLTRWATVVGGALGLVLLAVMAVTTPTTVSGPYDDPAGTTTGTPAGPTGAEPRRQVRPGPPLALRIPALGVRASVVAVDVDPDGVLVPPGDPRSVGWWSGGARPGDRRGAAVLTGHTVHDGGGVFDRLAALEAGDAVEVVTHGAVLAFDVRVVREVDRRRLAAVAGRLFSRSRAPCLVLVTCTGWDGERYLGNTVVVARSR